MQLPQQIPSQENQTNNFAQYQHSTSIAQSRQNQELQSSKRNYRLNSKKVFDDYNQLDLEERNSLMNKVYILLSIQNIVMYLLYKINDLRNFLSNNYTLALILIVFIALSIRLMHHRNSVKKYGLYFFIFFTICFTIFMIAMQAGITSILLIINKTNHYAGYYGEIHQAITTVMTGIIFTLTVLKITTKIDFEGYLPYVIAFISALIVQCTIQTNWTRPKYMLFYSFIAALLSSFLLIFHIHLILVRKNLQNTLDDAFVTVLQLYLDFGGLIKQILKAYAD